MVTPTFDISGHPGRGATRRTHPEGQILRHRLDVIAVSTGDVVQTVGGWLFDRAKAGWEVNVVLPRGCDARPLHVLGARVLDVLSDLDMPDGLSQCLAVSLEAFTADDRVRDRVRKALNARMREIALWGQGWPHGVNRGLTRSQYGLSVAARAFKGQALRAAGMPYRSVNPTETLFTDTAWLD